MRDPLEPDEAGYLLVARQWNLLEENWYGAYWVDRPPLLLLFFKAADLMPGAGPVGVRLLGCFLAVGMVLAAATAGHGIAGSRGARWAGLTAACLGSSLALGAAEAADELIAASLVLSSCAATVWALLSARSTGARLLLAFLGGVAGAAAVLVRQNMVDALVFAAITTVGAVRGARGRDRRRNLHTGMAGLAGAALLISAVLAWAALAGPGVQALIYTTYGFRIDAAATIAAGTSETPERRLVLLLGVGTASGLFILLVWIAKSLAAAARSGDPVSWGVAAMLITGLVGIVGGGSYWLPYLVQLIPVAAMGAALAVRTLRPTTLRNIVGYAVSASLIATIFGLVAGKVLGEPGGNAAAVGQTLRASSRPGDTAYVTYGHANVLLQAGLPSPYPYLWSLPTRVRDPQLRQLVRTVLGPTAPTWIVQWEAIDAWNIDRQHLMRNALARRYHLVGTVCGHRIYLLNGRPRTIRPMPVCGEF